MNSPRDLKLFLASFSVSDIRLPFPVPAAVAASCGPSQRLSVFNERRICVRYASASWHDLQSHSARLRGGGNLLQFPPHDKQTIFHSRPLFPDAEID